MISLDSAAGRDLVGSLANGLRSTLEVTRSRCLYAIVHNRGNADPLTACPLKNDGVQVPLHKEGSFPPARYTRHIYTLFGCSINRNS